MCYTFNLWRGSGSVSLQAGNKELLHNGHSTIHTGLILTSHSRNSMGTEICILLQGCRTQDVCVKGKQCFINNSPKMREENDYHYHITNENGPYHAERKCNSGKEKVTCSQEPILCTAPGHNVREETEKEEQKLKPLHHE